MVKRKQWWSCTWCPRIGYTNGKYPGQRYDCEGSDSGEHEWNKDTAYDTDLGKFPPDEYDIS